MKRFIILLLLCCLLLSGCNISGERIKEPVLFYYVRSEYQYFTQDGVIASEEHEASGHREDLSYLLALYLMGPAEEELTSPLPRGTKIQKAEQTPEGSQLQLSCHDDALTDADFSLACACLALTCFGLTDADTVTISIAERSITMGRDTLTIYDSSAAAVEETQ